MKRQDIKRRPMADNVLKALEPEAVQYREIYETGLYFQVKPTGARSWVMRYRRPDGRWNWIGLGAYPALRAPKARELQADHLKLVSQGIDPVSYEKQVEEQAATKRANLFGAVAEDWYQHNFAKWSPATSEKCRTYLDKDILPVLGKRPIGDITPMEAVGLVASIERRKAFNVAKKVRQWLRRIFSYAKAKGLVQFNPASDLNEVAAKAPSPEHFPYLLESELQPFLVALRAATGSPLSLMAARLVLLTGCRPGVVRAAEWCEFDLDKAEWEIPAEKMKMRRPHWVPLQPQLVALLRELHSMTGSYRYLFPSQGGYGKRNVAYLSEGAINLVYHRIGYKGRMTGHGSRHTASTLLSEHEWEGRYIDAQLSHKDKDPSAAAMRSHYNHASYKAQRRKMMQWYADYLDALEYGDPLPTIPKIH